jgi:hypothetical protein
MMNSEDKSRLCAVTAKMTTGQAMRPSERSRRKTSHVSMLLESRRTREASAERLPFRRGDLSNQRKVALQVGFGRPLLPTGHITSEMDVATALSQPPQLGLVGARSSDPQLCLVVIA